MTEGEPGVDVRHHDGPGETPAPADLPDEAWVLALASLFGMGPARLLAVLDRWAPAEAFSVVRRGHLGRHPEVVRALRGVREGDLEAWAKAAREADAGGLWHRHGAAGVEVCWRGGDDYPAPFLHDPEPPALLCLRGSLGALDRPRVAIVGTRRCTRYGREVAAEVGRDLASAGVAVVSGLAAGIDAAAHRGALAAPGGAPPVGVVGTGLDVVYPASSADLWRSVPERGLLLSEAPLGASGDRWRFPARNRLVAALADVLVVVESRQRGGSLYTVDEALRRDRPVLAVPGSVRSPASAGTNALLVDGAAPCRGAVDVLEVLGLSAAAHRSRSSTADADGRADALLGPDEALLLAELGPDPRSVDALFEAAGLALGRGVLALDRLEAAGRVRRQGGWVEVVDR